MKFNNDDIIALTGTIIFHLVILLILYFTVIRSIVPDEEEGILVNFGNVNLAAGVFEPRGRSLPGEDAASVPNEAPAVPKQTQPEEIISQDMEESISLTDKKKEEEQKKKAEAERKEKERIEAERKKQEEQRQRQQAINDRVPEHSASETPTVKIRATAKQVQEIRAIRSETPIWAQTKA